MSKICLNLTLAVLLSATILRSESVHAQSIPSQLAALQAQVTSLQATVSTLEKQVGDLQTNNAALQSQVNTLQTQLAVVQSNNALLLGPFVNIDPNPEIGVIGPNIIFSGANIHIVSGSGATKDFTGLGNLIIGYDEDPASVPSSVSSVPVPLAAGDRSGSHNLVIGRWNRFSQFAFGGIAAGELNTISGEASSVTGGLWNVVLGDYASVSGGFRNQAWGTESSVSGGIFNFAEGQYSTVSGGDNNFSRAVASSILGGANNISDGNFAVVLGGINLTVTNNLSILPQPPFP
jgi:hypothetical protein